jgi:hypothetical protein
LESIDDSDFRVCEAETSAVAQNGGGRAMEIDVERSGTYNEVGSCKERYATPMDRSLRQWGEVKRLRWLETIIERAVYELLCWVPKEE